MDALKTAKGRLATMWCQRVLIWVFLFSNIILCGYMIGKTMEEASETFISQNAIN